MSQLIVARRSHCAPRMRDNGVQPDAGNAIARVKRTSWVWKMVVRGALPIAIIVGVLAMHSFLSPAPQANATIAGALSVVSAQSEVSAVLHHVGGASASVVSGAAVFATDCAGCVGEMAAMLCFLVLLTAALMLFAPRLMGRWRRRVWLLLCRSLSAFTRYLAVVLPPPSLNALGISRT